MKKKLEGLFASLDKVIRETPMSRDQHNGIAISFNYMVQEIYKEFEAVENKLRVAESQLDELKTHSES